MPVLGIGVAGFTFQLLFFSTTPRHFDIQKLIIWVENWTSSNISINHNGMYGLLTECQNVDDLFVELVVIFFDLLERRDKSPFVRHVFWGIVFLLPCRLEFFECWDSAPESRLVAMRKKMLDGIGIGNDLSSVVDAIPVILLERESSPWNVLDWLSRTTDRGDWAEKFISRADEQIDRLVLKLVKSSSKTR